MYDTSVPVLPNHPEAGEMAATRRFLSKDRTPTLIGTRIFSVSCPVFPRAVDPDPHRSKKKKMESECALILLFLW